MNKIVYIIPGFMEKVQDKRYDKVNEFFLNKGFKIIKIKISWKYKTMSDYVEEFIKQFNQHNIEDEIYLLGFSFWAIISFIASTQFQIKAQLLCSLSPYFKEDLPFIRKAWKDYFWTRRVNNFNWISFNKLSKNIKCKTYIFYWTNEWPEVEKRAKDANKRILNNTLIRIEWAKHDLWQDVYYNEIKKIISKL